MRALIVVFLLSVVNFSTIHSSSCTRSLPDFGSVKYASYREESCLNLLSYSSCNDCFFWNGYAFLQAGFMDNRALYSTFGFEKQFFTVNAAVLYNHFTFAFSNWGTSGCVAEFAPHYDSLREENAGFYDYDVVELPNNVTGLITQVEGEPTPGIVVGDPIGTIAINGASLFEDWYRNIGNQLYLVTPDFPFIQLFCSWESFSGNHVLKFGRMKNLLSFNDFDTVWKQNVWFAPYQYWLCKDLYTGLTYIYSLGGLQLGLEIFGGDGNPVKNNCAPIYNQGTPNIKSNNTLLWGVNLLYQGKLSDCCDLLAFGGVQSTKIGSTWAQGTCNSFYEGKSNQRIVACGGELGYCSKGVRLAAFGQYTGFLSGLSEGSSQVALIDSLYPGLARDIWQQGFFLGTRMEYRCFECGFAYELFDRYDYKCARFQYLGRKTVTNDGLGFFNVRYDLSAYQNAKLETYTANATLKANQLLKLRFGYNYVVNPLWLVSNILPDEGQEKVTFAAEFSF
jgi:hypothetical protein